MCLLLRNRVVKVKLGKYHTTTKSVAERIQLGLPKDRLPKFCETRRYGNYSKLEARPKAELLELSDAELLLPTTVSSEDSPTITRLRSMPSGR
jgi:hypothetical protein